MSRRPPAPFDPWVVATVLVVLIGSAAVLGWAVSKEGELPPPHRSAAR